MKKIIKEGLGFCGVGLSGAILNGIIYGGLSRIDIFNFVPIPISIFKSLSIAWGLGIFLSALWNFFLDRYWVFKIQKYEKPKTSMIL
jgi:hypothetical protein